MVLHPYYIYYQLPGGEPSQDSEGNFLEGSPSSWKFYDIGRDSANTRGNLRTLVDGTSFQYSAILYAPTNKTILQEGTQILLATKKIKAELINESFIAEGFKSGLIRVNKPCMGFSASQHNTRIWV